MKKMLATLPLAFIVMGCSGPINEDAANSNSSIVSATNSVHVANAADSNTPSGNAVNVNSSSNSTTDKSAPAGNPDPAYKVTDTSMMPSSMAAAMNKVKVPPPPKDMKVPDKAKVQFNTKAGPIVVELNGKEAPLHVKSFLYLAQKGFFNGTIFHRYADLMEGSGKPGRIIQGGDPFSRSADTRSLAGQGGPGYEIPREHNNLKHDAMVLAAARSQDPDSAGSQFYFTMDPVYFLDQGDGYTVFGKVISGQANVLKLKQGDQLKSVTVLK